MRLSFGTRTVGAAYLAVAAATAAGAAAGGGAVAVTWAAVSGAMGVAWLARTDAEVGPDRIRLPRRGLRVREVALAELVAVEVPHPWAVDPVGRARLTGDHRPSAGAVPHRPHRPRRAGRGARHPRPRPAPPRPVPSRPVPVRVPGP